MKLIYLEEQANPKVFNVFKKEQSQLFHHCLLLLLVQVCQKSGEISLLKQQLKEIQSELSQKAGDIVVLKAQLRETRSELQASQARTQEAQVALRTRSLELEVCENELQRRKSEAELLREKLGRVEEESARLRDALSSHIGHSVPGNVIMKGQCMSLSVQQERAVGGRGGPSPCVYRDGEETHLVWGGESDEAKAQRQNAENMLGLRQQVHILYLPDILLQLVETSHFI